MANLSEIAARLNLNVSVVSRALNPNPDKNAVVRKETRELIRRTAQEMGYRPNRQASFLKKGKSPTILCFLPDTAERLIADLMFGISERACQDDFPVNFFFGKTTSEFMSFLQKSDLIGHSGIIGYPPYILHRDVRLSIENYLSQGGKMLIMNVISNGSVSSLSDSLKAIPQMNIDDYYGGQLVAKHFLEIGCRKFYVVGSRYRERLDGFISEIKTNGFSVEQFPSCDLRKFKTVKEKMGIFAEHDFLAGELITRFALQGILPGEKIMLAGFDDQLMASCSFPSLTTVHQPTREEGRLAVETLIRLIYNKSVCNKTLKPYLVVRETTGGKRST